MNFPELHDYLKEHPGSTSRQVARAFDVGETRARVVLREMYVRGYATRDEGPALHYYAANKPKSRPKPSGLQERVTEEDLARMRQHSPDLERLVRAELERMRR